MNTSWLAARGWQRATGAVSPAAFDRRSIPPGRRCSSLAYARYARSSRLARRASRRSWCDAGFCHGLLAVCGLLVAAGAAAETLEWDTSTYSQEVTPCDIEASHGDDPYSVAPGISQQEMDYARAMAACEAAVAADPGNPRLRYQLARVYGYSGQGEKAYPHREAAIAADYPQALFVNGYLHFLGINKARKDVCRAGSLFRRSAQYSRLAGQVGFTRYALDGAFEGCDVTIDPEELMMFLEAAEESNSGFYESMLIAMLKKEVTALEGENE